MIVIYDSMTGNVERFVKKLGILCIQIQEGMMVKEDFILITYTTGFGCIPESVEQFLQHNYPYLRGVSASGNRNWGYNFAISADKISQQYNVPIISKFELSGTKNDVIRFMEGVRNLETCGVK